MSNYQRRKNTIDDFNMLYCEKQAYAEDRARDPEKYRYKRTSKDRRSSSLLAAVMASSVMTVSRGDK